MLTKNDLIEIKSVVNDVVEEKLKPIKKDIAGIDTVIEAKLEPIRKGVHGIDSVIEEKLKPIKKDLSYLRKTVDIIARNYDEGDVKLEKRVRKIEKHLGLPQGN